jgi:hypothetical protein
MPNPLAFLPNAVSQPQQKIIWGQVSTNQPAPTSFSQPLYVTRPAWNPDYNWTITDWPACHGSTLPAQGAECMLIIDTANNLRCVWWDGTAPTAASTSGETAGYTAGTGTAVTVDGKTTGGLGSTAYTFGDVVLALKQIGVLKP